MVPLTWPERGFGEAISPVSERLVLDRAILHNLWINLWTVTYGHDLVPCTDFASTMRGTDMY
jgi:hypothetical protein